jgi:hypothetical protein
VLKPGSALKAPERLNTYPYAKKSLPESKVAKVHRLANEE